jgi:heme-degrading monooxygenase HmoA
VNAIAVTPEPPYYAVVFTSLRTEADADAYAQASEMIVRLAARQPGFLGIESVRDGGSGFGITVSYWQSEEAIAAWKAVAEHRVVQRLGRRRWYRAFHLRVARVERASSFSVGEG